MEIPAETLVEMQRRMLRVRKFDDAACVMIAAGELPGPAHTSTNQEASVVGATLALRTEDYMTGNHRSHGHPIGKGASLDGLMAELLGKRTGICKGKGGSMHLADFSVGSLGESGIVASGIPIAVGAGLSAKLRNEPRVSLCFFGDGAANSGAVHESMNLAAIWRLPVIFLCENNGFAVSMAASRSTSVERIATRARGYSMPGATVDGQDPIAVYEATFAAAERAREGGGPSLVEALTYRTREHAEGLIVDGYRTADEIQQWSARDPIVLFGKRLVDEGVLSSNELADLDEEVAKEVARAVRFAKESPEPLPEEAYDDLFSDPPELVAASSTGGQS